VAERVVDGLEVVEVDEEQPDPAMAAVEGDQSLGQAVHERQPVGQPGDGVVKGLLGQGLLGQDLRSHVAGHAEGPDDAPFFVPQRQLGGRDPGVRTAAVRLPLDLGHHGLAAADNPLLVLEGGEGVLVAEEVEV